MRPLWLILALACSAALPNGAARANGTALTDKAAPATAPVPAVRPLYFEHVTTRDGLSQSTVMSILQDAQGYLWLGTQSGLDRYDGYSIREYRRQRGYSAGLASDYIWAIAEDDHNNLWLATEGGGIERWDRNTDRFQRFKHDPLKSQTLASDAVRALLIDAQGRIWAGTLDQGLDVLDPRTGSVRHFRHRDGDPRSLPADGVCVLYTDHSGRIWVGTDGGLSEYQPSFAPYAKITRARSGSARAEVDSTVSIPTRDW
jgi:ligand-binding sensor domain-containing protein